MREEQAHAEYDALLGWINRADLHLPDLYGPGRSFRTNAQRFRAVRPYPPDPPPGGRPVLEEADVRAAASRVFRGPARSEPREGQPAGLVYLPESGDRSRPDSDRWREFGARDADRLGVRFVDLVETFRALPPDEGQRFFVIPYRRSHYNPGGNAWVARELRARLFTAPVESR
jgi:hypothetical protein